MDQKNHHQYSILTHMAQEIKHSKEEISYEDAREELQSILQKLEEGQASIEALEQLVARSKWLVQFCQDRLKEVKSQLQSIEKE